MNRTLIVNATVINEGRKSEADVLISGDRIEGIFEPGSITAPAADSVIDAAGMWLLPGIIDDHVHFREPGLTHKAEISTESAAGAAGGVTSFMDMPNTVPQTVTVEAWRMKNTLAAATSVINYAFYLGATNDNAGEIDIADPRSVPGLKLFLGASTGNMLVDSEKSLDRIFSVKKFPVACHCEDEETIRKNIALYRERYGDDAPPSLHPVIRSREACLKSSMAAIERASRNGTRLHLLHLSSAEETGLLTPGDMVNAKQVTAEACVHHLWFDDSWYEKKGNLIKWNPPVREAKDRNALVAAVRDGRIDIIATDHAPHTLAEKSEPYFKAPSGAPVIQHSLVMMLDLCERGELTPETVVRKMCHNPALLFGINDRGFIREGYKADLVIVDPASPWKVGPENILSKCGWSPLEGTVFRSQVRTTFVNGVPVFLDGRLTGKRSPEMLTFNR